MTVSYRRRSKPTVPQTAILFAMTDAPTEQHATRPISAAQPIHIPGTRRFWLSTIGSARDLIARGLAAVGITPNVLTILGFLATCATAVCFFRGGGYSHANLRELGLPPYVLIGAVFLLIACAMDMLDGAVARIGRMATPLGAVLDSSVDRLSDAIIYIALVGHFALRGNLTYSLFAILALTNAMLISYVKARSECIIPDCSVGYWARPERCVALLSGGFGGSLSGALWSQAILPAFTVLRRLRWLHAVLAAKEHGTPLPVNKPPVGLTGLLRPWRYPRGSLPFDVISAANIAFAAVAPYLHPIFRPESDPLRTLLAN